MTKKKIIEGSLHEMIIIAVPMVVSHACDTCMTFTDRLFLARLGPAVMNASMGGGLTCFTMMTFFMGLIGYGTALSAQYLGANQKSKCAVVTMQGMIIVCCSYPLVLCLRPFAHMLFSYMGVAAEQLVPQKIYFDILLYGTVIRLMRHCLSSFFSGIGKTRIVMIASVTAMTLNIVLNYIFIFGKFGCPALGIRGAAYGTILGSMGGLIVLGGAYLGGKYRREYNVLQSFVFDKIIMKKLLRFGYPAGLEMFLNLFAFTMMVLTFHSVGLVSAVASTIMCNWDMVSFVPLLGIEIAVTSLVGRYMGAGNPDAAHRSVMSGLKLGWIYSAFIFVAFIGFPKYLVGVFSPDQADAVFLQAFPVAVFMVRAAALYVLIEAIYIVFIGALRGAGDTFWAMCISVSLHWILVPILLVMLKVFGLAIEVSWLAVIFLFMLFSGIVYLRYHSGKWKDIRIVGTVEPVNLVHDDFHEQADI